MSQQKSDLPRFVQIIGRYKTLIGIMALLGLLGGAVFAELNPPASTNSAVVVFAAPQCEAGAICGGIAFSPAYIQAQVIAALPSGVQIKPMAGNVLSISAAGGTAAQAEAAADAAAHSYIVYAGSLGYLGEQASATLLQPAGIATEPTPPKQLFTDALLGAVFGALAGIIAALAAGQTIIDPVTLPRAGTAGGATGGAGQGTWYASTETSLEQMALEYTRRRAASDNPPGRSEAEPP